MIHLFCFTFAVFGVTFCVGHAKISLHFRMWLDDGVHDPSWASRWFLALIECPACLATWLGAGAVALGVSPHVFGSGVIGAIFCAFYCCATSLFLARFAGLDEE